MAVETGAFFFSLKCELPWAGCPPTTLAEPNNHTKAHWNRGQVPASRGVRRNQQSLPRSRAPASINGNCRGANVFHSDQGGWTSSWEGVHTLPTGNGTYLPTYLAYCRGYR